MLILKMQGVLYALIVLLCYYCIPSLTSHLNQASKTFHIVEKSPEGTVVVNDLRQLLEAANTNDGLLAISNAALPGASNFKIDQNRGSLVIATPPDRDALCPSSPRGSLDFVSVGSVGDRRDSYHGNDNQALHPKSLNPQCMIQLTIVYGASSDPSFDSITIILDDLNDHAPKFAENVEEHIIRVLETSSLSRQFGSLYSTKLSPSKVRIPLPEAMDLDAPENGVRHYRLEGEDAYLFYLEIGRGDEGAVVVETNTQQIVPSSEKRLWLIPSRISGETPSGLDYEYRKEYRFVLVAVDGGMPPRSGRLPIRLIVEDVNDHVPTFTETQYSGIMSEDDLPGHVVLQLQATDSDGKYENHRINFRIPGKDDQSTSLAFSEAQASAANLFEIELINSYDYNSDSSGDIRKNATTGQLIVQRKSESHLKQAAKRALEAAKKLQINSIEILNPRLRYRPLNVRSYLLRFIVEAYDFGKPPLSSRVPVYVEIIDVNDEAPEIFVNYISMMSQQQGRKNQCGNLLEGQGRSMIAQITVIDNDASSINTEVACALNDTRFSLEPISTINNVRWTGIGISSQDGKSNQATLMYKLMSNSAVDRESALGSTISVQITCVDNQNVDTKSKRLTSRADICINIEDINDNPPQFASSVYTFKVAENLPSNKSINRIGHFIGKIQATDRDTGPNARIQYYVSQNAKGIVEIDTNNGSLYLVSPFDREKTRQFVFTVIATDQADGNHTTYSKLSGSAEVRIIITDMNDCQPEFESANYNFEVEENVELADLAVDEHQTGGSNHSNKPSGNSMITSLFQIDPRLGIIRLRGHLDREKCVHYEFLVHAVDNIPVNADNPSGHSTVRFTATATVMVVVLDQNDNPPQIQSPRNLAEFMLSPDQMVAGTTIFTIDAADSDQGENATIEYELMIPEVPPENSSDLATARVAKNFPFAIDQTTGVCYLKQNLPPIGSDGSNIYTFRVKAYDLGTPSSLNSTVTVRIIRGNKALSGIYTDPFLIHGGYKNEGMVKVGGTGGHFSGGEWLGDWGADTGGVPNKTLAIIVAAVFAVLILLTILIVVYFRHQKSFNTRTIINGVLGSQPPNKCGAGYIAGNKALHLDSATDTIPRKAMFTEVVTAPWVNAASSVHSPAAFAYPGMISPRLLHSRQQQQQQQLYLRSPTVNVNTSMSNQQTTLKSGNLKSPSRFAQVTQSPAFTPSTVVFRNYRVTGGDGDSNYQTAISPVMPKKSAVQRLDYQYTGSGVPCMSSNNSSLLSKTSDLIDTSDPKDNVGLIRMDTNKRKSGRERNNSISEFSAPLAQDDLTSNYQHLVNDNAGIGTVSSQYIIHMPESNSPLTFENRHSKGEMYPLTSPANVTGQFMTPGHHGRLAPTIFKPPFRSFSIDSSLDNISSTDYPPVTFSPNSQTTRRGRSLQQRMVPPPLAAPEKRLNFITNSKTLSPEIRGSFVSTRPICPLCSRRFHWNELNRNLKLEQILEQTQKPKPGKSRPSDELYPKTFKLDGQTGSRQQNVQKEETNFLPTILTGAACLLVGAFAGAMSAKARSDNKSKR
nr:protocadherin 11 [Hymenolepis microstoma]